MSQSNNQNSKADRIQLAIENLNREERLIVILRYHEKMTMEEIGQTLDLSEGRVRQIHGAIVDRMKSQSGDNSMRFCA